MANVLIADDSVVDRRLAGGLLEKQLGANLRYAEDGRAALAALEQEVPDLVLTDLQMPHVTGLELVAHMRKHHPTVPVVLMTAHGSEEIAIEALRRGAASYVPKRLLATDLASTVQGLLALAVADREKRRVFEYLTQAEWMFDLENDTSLIAPLVAHIENELKRMKVCDETDLIRVAVALREALVNAVEHGNLEVESELRETNPESYYDLVEERSRTEPYCRRRVRVAVRKSRSQTVFEVCDEGRGYDPSVLPDPTDPANLEKVSGRGLLLIRTFMDEVSHDQGGRQLTMVKRADTVLAPEAAP
jgi:CheY-like chemotaxis protein/anti-sigma regulatory factor (Ser/Thr protein kinase)